MRILTKLAILLIAATGICTGDQPNVVLIYADDLGFGDLACYGAQTVATPAADRLAAEGLRFTDAHAPSATCTPSRYAMMTGEYAWRRKGTGIARGNAPLIIDPGQTTMASSLRKQGYTCGVVGKWHLGLGPKGGEADWNGVIKPGPLELGFDYSFLIPATGDRVPCVYVENHRIVGLDPADPIRVGFGKPVGNEPTGLANPELLKMHPSHGHNQTIINGISRIGYMEGGKAARWVDEDMADVITKKAVQFVENNKDKPFFLFFSYHDIHVPRVPHPRFVGKTPMGPRGDCIAQMDWCTGQLLDALDHSGLRENTLVIFTSDNGPVVDDGYHDDAVLKLGSHHQAGPFRGGKYSKFEGGTRVPLLVRWPAKVKAGKTSPALVSQVDFLHSLSQLTGGTLDGADGPDSFNILPALLGETVTGRDHLVEHGNGLALRMDNWKFIPDSKGPRLNKNTNIELGHLPRTQLYHLGSDPMETLNVANAYPEQVELMKRRLGEIQENGRSR